MRNKMVTIAAAAFAAAGLAAAAQVQAGATYDFSGQTGTTISPVTGVFTGGFNAPSYVTPVNDGTSSLQFNGTNAYTASDDGSVTSVAGLSFGTGSKATVALDGTNLTDSGALNSGSGTTIENGSSTAVTLTNSGGNNSSFHGNIQDGGASSLSLVTSGTSPSNSTYLRLFGANTYTGGTTINTYSTIEADTNTALGSGLITLNGGTLSAAGGSNPGTTLTNNITGSGYLNPYTNNNLTLNGSLTGGGEFQRTAFNYSLFLGGNNSGFSGTFNYTSGALRINSVNSGSAAALWIVSANTFSLDTTGNYQLGGLQGNNTGFIYNGTLGAVTLTLGGRNDTLDNYSGSIQNGSGSISVVKTGTGTQEFSGANTYTGNTTISAGILALGVANAIKSSSRVIMNGGTLASKNFSQTLGTLNLTGNSSIDLGSANTGAKIAFAASNAIAWTPSDTLSILNWNGSISGGGLDQLLVGTSGSGLTAAQLAEIQFVDPFGLAAGDYSATQLSTGELVPFSAVVPEPASLGLLFAGAAGLLLLGRKAKARA